MQQNKKSSSKIKTEGEYTFTFKVVGVAALSIALEFRKRCQPTVPTTMLSRSSSRSLSLITSFSSCSPSLSLLCIWQLVCPCFASLGFAFVLSFVFATVFLLLAVFVVCCFFFLAVFQLFSFLRNSRV